LFKEKKIFDEVIHYNNKWKKFIVVYCRMLCFTYMYAHYYFEWNFSFRV